MKVFHPIEKQNYPLLEKIPNMSSFPKMTFLYFATKIFQRTVNPCFQNRKGYLKTANIIPAI